MWKLTGNKVSLKHATRDPQLKHIFVNCKDQQ